MEPYDYEADREYPEAYCRPADNTPDYLFAYDDGGVLVDNTPDYLHDIPLLEGQSETPEDAT